ncbi:hypothetical protein [Basilea psittacipulmonis]|uniref:Uncharacterized protein n=1 Tax=Basilea psittacipulmonis DSM 24701 TaxID=1072685 RepID=A0A077DET8_9BURK|nr:hypothetical protein [Basilea psittacipulmonis]AIL31927.1 hypothetical protein IX83_00035 [Basilea psittacipulmonis DSM 24701]
MLASFNKHYRFIERVLNSGIGLIHQIACFIKTALFSCFARIIEQLNSSLLNGCFEKLCLMQGWKSE